MRLNGPMLRIFLNFGLRALLSSGSRPSNELSGSTVALCRFWPILCSIIEKGDSRFPKRMPPGKSPSRSSENPGMNFRISFSRPGVSVIPAVSLIKSV